MTDLKLDERESPYTYMSKEIEMMRNEVNNLDDNSLIDECYAIAFRFNERKVLGIIEEFNYKGRIKKHERKYLENFYVLVHTELMWGIDGTILHFR